MFGDSSQDVFSAVAFLRGKVNTGNGCSTEIAFVIGKARVAPMKALTIPPARKTCFQRTPFLEHRCRLFRTLLCNREAVH